MTTYDIGDQVQVQATFTDSAGTVTNTTVVLTVERPDGTVSTVSTTNPSTGVYRGTVTVDAEGHWHYRFGGSGTIIAAEVGEFYVRRRRA